MVPLPDAFIGASCLSPPLPTLSDHSEGGTVPRAHRPQVTHENRNPRIQRIIRFVGSCQHHLCRLLPEKHGTDCLPGRPPTAPDFFSLLYDCYPDCSGITSAAHGSRLRPPNGCLSVSFTYTGSQTHVYSTNG